MLFSLPLVSVFPWACLLLACSQMLASSLAGSDYLLPLPRTVSLWVSLSVLPACLCLHTYGSRFTLLPRYLPWASTTFPACLCNVSTRVL